MARSAWLASVTYWALGSLLVAHSTSAQDLKTIYGGPADAGQWQLNGDGKPVPDKSATEEGINPHGSGGYVVIHDDPIQDFVLDFDYKLSPGCNSGVFIRVGNPKDPVMTGIEIALDDANGTGLHDPGAFYDLKGPETAAQKPAGEWNHMRVTAKGPIVTVELNGQEVNRIDLDEFDKPGLRPDGSRHKFSEVVVKSLNQKGYLGFQDHGSDCWFKNVKLAEIQ